MSRPHGIRARLGLALAVLCAGPPARADWPMQRHDAARSGTASNAPCGITTPAARWRHYLGGTVAFGGMLSADLDGDGHDELIFVSGGKVLAKRADDALLWETPLLDLRRLSAPADLDGDGVLDVIAWGPKLYVIHGKTGAIEWEEPDGEMANVNAVRVADLDGDGRPEVIIDECHCCDLGVGSPGVVYSFEAGWKNARLHFTLPDRPRCFGFSDAIGDFDGDGKNDLAYVSSWSVMMVRGTDGALLGRSQPVVNARGDRSSCEALDVDGKKGDELVCFLSEYWAGANEGGRMVWVAKYDPKAVPTVQILWLQEYSHAPGSQLQFVGGSAGDLDHDGRPELVFATNDGMTGSVLRVLDALTGTELGTYPAGLSGVADLDGDQAPELLVRAGTDAKALRFRRAALPPLSVKWTLAGNYGFRNQTDFRREVRTGNAQIPVALDLDADGHLDPVITRTPSDGPYEIAALKGDLGDPPKMLAQLLLPDGITSLSAFVAESPTRPGRQLVFARNDGFLVVLDGRFRPTNEEAGEFALPGVRIGGFYSGPYAWGAIPIAPSLDGGPAAVVASDSRGAILRLDPTGASLIDPPSVRWQLRSASSPVLAPGLAGGKPGLACYRGSQGPGSGPEIWGIDADGRRLWSSPLPPGNPYEDMLSGDATGDGVADLFTVVRDSSNNSMYQVYDGKTGKPLWASALFVPIVAGIRAFAAADWDGDGLADLVGELNELVALRGLDGKEIARGPFGGGHLVSTLDLDGDGALEALIHSGVRNVMAYRHDLKTVFWAGMDSRTQSTGVAVACPGGTVWVQALIGDPGQVHFVTVAGPKAGAEGRLYLAGGGLFPTAQAMIAAGRRPGYVGNATVKPDLVGAGTHASLLFGSTDGWLYALDACAGTLDWSYEFKFPVGEPILADTDGDGKDEILVTVADGYLYSIGQQILAAPRGVIDADGPAGTRDVDEITTVDTLYAAWEPVPGATSYEVAVITAAGSYVTQPEWQNVGDVTRVQRGALPLVDGRRYLVAVRALSPKGASSEALSNGVVAHVVGTLPVDMSAAPDLAAPDAGDPPPQAMTWEKFARTVLPTAERIEFSVPAHGAFIALVTAANPDAPPMMQWDREDSRNPVSWYVYSGGSPANGWNLRAHEFVAVTAITLLPSMWNEPEKSRHHGAGVILLLDGARDTRHRSGGGMFVENLRSEYHPIRRTLEAHFLQAPIAGGDEATACGYDLRAGENWNAVLRVTAAGIQASYRLDRWD